MSPYGAITEVIDLAHQQAMAKQAALLARMAVSAEVRDTLLLPSAEMTAWHEVGHAIMHAITGVPVARVMIWPAPAYGGFSGRCLLPPDYVPPELIAHLEPDRALVRVCNTLADWAAEHAYSGAQVEMGSSLDEQVVASHLADIVAEGLGIDPILMNLAVASVTYEALKDEVEVATRLHQKLLKARRVGGWQLQHRKRSGNPILVNMMTLRETGPDSLQSGVVPRFLS